jgi:hypothetical protein
MKPTDHRPSAAAPMRFCYVPTHPVDQCAVELDAALREIERELGQHLPIVWRVAL